jgi:hypothetical protein
MYDLQDFNYRNSSKYHLITGLIYWMHKKSFKWTKTTSFLKTKKKNLLISPLYKKFLSKNGRPTGLSYSKGRVLRYKRSKTNQSPNTFLLSDEEYIVKKDITKRL